MRGGRSVRGRGECDGKECDGRGVRWEGSVNLG